MVQCQPDLDRAFSALSDATRRGILEALGQRQRSISELAERFDMTLTGIKKHVRMLEEAGLVTTRKVGRVRTCRLGRERLREEARWIDHYRRMQGRRLDQLGEFLERTKAANDDER